MYYNLICNPVLPQSWTQHHWVLRRKAHSSKCKECNKTLPKGPTWASNRSSKAFVAVSCSWCKDIVSLKSGRI